MAVPCDEVRFGGWCDWTLWLTRPEVGCIRVSAHAWRALTRPTYRLWTA
jgi:hypothetical protein